MANGRGRDAAPLLFCKFNEFSRPYQLIDEKFLENLRELAILLAIRQDMRPVRRHGAKAHRGRLGSMKCMLRFSIMNVIAVYRKGRSQAAFPIDFIK